MSLIKCNTEQTDVIKTVFLFLLV